MAKAPTKLSPFTFVQNVSKDSFDMYTPDTEKMYIPFIVNRALGYYLDTVLYANDMNLASNLSPRAQYLYLLNSLPKRSRYSSWQKRTESVETEAIMTVYKCSRQKAEEIAALLTPAQLEQIKTICAGINHESPVNRQPSRSNNKKA